MLTFLAAHLKTVLGILVSFVGAVAGWGVVVATSVSVEPPTAVVGAAIVAATSYLIAVRRQSGRVSHSEAAELWTAAEQIRKELRDECDRLRTRVRELEGRIRELEASRT